MVDALVSIALEKLTDVVGRQLSLFAGATHELENLSHTFRSIQAVLKDAESRQVGDESVQLWLSRLKHVAYDIQDLLEDGQISGLREEGNKDDGNRQTKARSLFGFAYNAPSRHKIANDIKKIKERLDRIDVERNRFGFSCSPLGVDHSMPVRSERLETSLIDESEIVGREDDKETMISRLVSGSSSNEGRGQVQVVAIAGIGGLGKTTLARLIYHDGKVQEHFATALYWVCVSDVFYVTKLTKAILEQVKGTYDFPSELDKLQKELQGALSGKRFLLVLDDVWNDDDEKWGKLRLSLISGANGSRILVTTRSERVAKTMNANYIHQLKGLSDDQSWTLFSGRAFGGRREGDCSEFESIGKEIVKKCKGVPLSIKVIGSAMETKRTMEDWKNVLESKIWALPQAAGKILPALLLTYFHLPLRLKQCFVYCSMFPKDWNFKKDMLIGLWVAQGFIISEGNREKEDIASECFDELVARSMFQKIEGKNEGNIRCKMHDLLHDLAEFIAKDEIHTYSSNGTGGQSEECSGSSDVRHIFLSLACIDGKPNMIPIAAGRAKKLRSLWLDKNVVGEIDKSDSGIIDLIHQARFLRALYLPSASRFPKSIGKLKHLTYLCLPHLKVKLPDAIRKMQQLKYLDLSRNSNIVELPESVCDLHNLHTLNLSCYTKLEKLPRGIGGMVGLRYLDLSYNLNMVELPESMVDLCNLHTLDLSDCEKLEKLPRGIGGMANLRDLDLSYNSNMVELPESMGDLRNLHTLNLSDCEKLEKLPRSIGGMVGLRYLDLSYNSNMVELPESMGDLRNLRTLKLHYCEKLEKLPRGIGGMANLRDLDLSWNSNMVELPESMVDLRNLHTLNLSHCEKLEKLPRGIDGMANLRDLDLSWNSNMVELPESVGDLRNLHTLKLSGCNKLEKLPRGIGGMVTLRHLEIKGTNGLKYLPKGLGRISGPRSLSKFIVGGGDEGEGCGIDELQSLNPLQGTLEIEHLERVASPEEAEKAELWKKQDLCKLALRMSAGRHDDVEAERIDGVLEGLRPHENLEELTLYGCTGSKLPSWIDGMRDLRKLEIKHVPQLERVPHLPSLKEFELVGLKNEMLPDEGWEQLVALRKTSIRFCKELKCLPVGLTQLSSIENLYISFCGKLESLPEWLGQFRKLHSLEIQYCQKLKSLPESLGQLKQLKSLCVGGSKLWRCLPDSIGQLESLEILEIHHLKKLESLPDSLGELKALSRLEIWNCGALASLPRGLRHLSSLYIKYCPQLQERYKREGGANWPNISHIPDINIDVDPSGAAS